MFTLLVVDDDRAILELFSLALERPGLRLVTARSVVQAAHVIKLHSVDAAILDVQLTTANRREGLDVLQFLRQLRPKAKAIVITGSAQPNLKEAALGAGACCFLRKPVELRELERQLLRLGLPKKKLQRTGQARTASHSTVRVTQNRLRRRTALAQ